jgi:hypothetical protein
MVVNLTSKDSYYENGFSVYIREISLFLFRALGVRSRKLSNLREGQSSDGAPPYFGRHVKPLIPAAIAVVCTHSSFKKG